MSMSRPAVFFDRDNTLIISDGYLGDPSKVVLIAGAAEAVARLRRDGFAIVVVSNQSGIARGMFDERAAEAVDRRMAELLRNADPDARIDGHEFCPHHPEAPLPEYRLECECRKPRPGMILKAAHELGLDLSRSWLVGDAPRDVEAGAAAGCRTILFADATLPASPATQAKMKVQPDFRAGSLKEAADRILSQQDQA
jgi:D,D-heptose 1,7-bisphosphate phosphatase